MSAQKSRLEGNRKLVGFALLVSALMCLALVGVKPSSPAYEMLLYGFGVYVAGNFGERWTKARPAPGPAP